MSGEIRQKQDDRPKRTLAAELHNMSERVLSLLYTITTAKTGLIY